MVESCSAMQVEKIRAGDGIFSSSSLPMEPHLLTFSSAIEQGNIFLSIFGKLFNAFKKH